MFSAIFASPGVGRISLGCRTYSWIQTNNIQTGRRTTIRANKMRGHIKLTGASFGRFWLLKNCKIESPAESNSGLAKPSKDMAILTPEFTLEKVLKPFMSLHVQARVSGNPRQRKQWKVQLHKVELLVSVSKGKRAGAAWGFSFFSVKSHVCDALRRFCCFINAAQTGGGNLSHLPLHSGNNYPFGDVSKPAGFPRKAAGKTTSLMNLTHLRTAAKFRSLQSLQLFARHHGLLSNF